MFSDSPLDRACGRRIRGGIYAETHLSRHGLPIEYFIVDPPITVDLAQLGLAAMGVQLIEVQGADDKRQPASDGVHHIFDVVGQEFYPYPADYVEETRRLGASRRLPANLDFSKLGPGSRLVLIHARALIENFSVYPQPPQLSCPKGIALHAHAPLPEMCAGLWWHDLPGEADAAGAHAGQPTRGETDSHDERLAANRAPVAFSLLRRIEGGTQYYGYPRPAGVIPSYRHGIFLSLPISNLAVIQGGEATERNYQTACFSGLPVNLEEA
jgi:hypothetical protein